MFKPDETGRFSVIGWIYMWEPIMFDHSASRLPKQRN